MANGVKQDVELRINAGKLDRKPLQELLTLLERVEQAQLDFARSGDVSSRSLRELQQDIRDLDNLGRQIAGRGALVDLFEKQELAVKDASTRLNEARAALETYKNSLTGVETVSRKQQSQLARLEKSVLSAEKSFERANGAIEKTRTQLSQLGLADTQKAKTELVGFANQVGAALVRGEQAIRDYDTQLRQKRQLETEGAQASRDYATAQQRVNQAVRQLQATDEFRQVGIQAIEAARATNVLSRDFDQLAVSGRKGGDGIRAILDPSRSAIQTIDGLERELEGLEHQLAEAEGSAELREQLRGVRSELAQLTKEAGRSAAALSDDIGSYRRQSAAVEALRQRFVEARRAVIEYGAQIALADQPSDELSRSLRIAQDRLAGLSAQFEKESITLANMRLRLREAGVDVNNLAESERRLEGVANRVVGSQQRLGVATVQMGRGARNAANELANLNDQGRKSLSVYQRIRGQVLALASTYIGLYGALNLVNRAVEAQQNRRALEIRLLTAANNDTRQAAQDMIFLRGEADRLGFALNDLGSAYSKIRIAGAAVGLSVTETREIFSSFAEVARANFLSVEDMEGVFRALEQVMSKGKVQAEELRGQLGDRLPGAFVQFAKSMNISVAQLDEALKKGEVGADQLLDFARQYASTVQNTLPEATKELTAELQRGRTALQDFLIVIAESGLAEAVSELTDSFVEFLNSDDGVRTAQQISNVFSGLGHVLLVLIENFDALVSAGRIFIAVMGVRFILNMVAGFARMTTGVRLLTLSLGTATTAATRFRRAMFLLAGPVGLVLGALTEVFIALSESTDGVAEAQYAAAKSSSELEASLYKVMKATGDTLEVEKERHELLLAEAKQRVENARLAAEAAERELNAARKRREALKRERDELAKRNLGLAANYGLTVVPDAGVTPAEEKVKAATALVNELAAAYEEARAQYDLLINPPPDPEGSGESGPDEDLIKKRKKLEKKAADFILDVRRDLLESAGEDLDAQLQLIDIEYDKRIAALRELQAELRKVGLDEQANQLNVQASYIESLRVFEKIQQRKEFAREREEEQEKRVTKEVRDREKALDKLLDERDAKIDLINKKRELGLLTDQQALEQAAQTELSYRDQILAKIQELVDYINSVDPDLVEKLGLRETLAEMEKLAFETTNVLTQAQIEGRRLMEEFSEGAVGGFRAFASGLAEMSREGIEFKDVLLQTRDAFREFAADFLIRIGEMILQQAILNSLQGSSFFGGLFNSAGGAVSGGLLHTGGIAGNSNPSKRVSPWLFAAAPRYHTGGIAGLAPNEVPAVLKRGEEVLTQSDPRHVANGGTQPSGGLRIINAIDSASVIEAGMNTPTGEKVFFNLIQANRSKIRHMLG